MIGSGGHSKVVKDIIKSNQFKLVGVLDDNYSDYREEEIITGPIKSVENLNLKTTKLVIAIGSNKVRKEVVEEYNLISDDFVTLIHPSAQISKSAKISAGTVVMPNAVINSDAYIGEHVIINTAVVVEHDVTVNDYCHLSPGCVLTGNSRVDSGSHIGANATFIPGSRVGSWSTIGAGAVVTKELPSNCTAVGVPAKVIKYHKE